MSPDLAVSIRLMKIAALIRIAGYLFRKQLTLRNLMSW